MAERRVTLTAPAAAPPAGTRPRSAARLHWWGTVLVIFGASRVVTTVLFLWVWTQATPQSRARPGSTFLDLVSAWDGQWYWYIAENGYPSVLPLTGTGAVATNQWAFLPVYPYLAKALGFGVLDWRIPALAVSVLAGFGAAVLVAALLLPHIGRDRAVFAAALFSCSPLAFMFQTTYAESLGLLLLLGALLLVDRGRYLAAVPVALLLAFTRPGVLALALAVGLQVLVRARRARRGGPPCRGPTCSPGSSSPPSARSPASRGPGSRRSRRVARTRTSRPRARGGRCGCPTPPSRSSSPGCSPRTSG
ncbi:hypothetical protein [Amnibacterium kyonggiense]